VRAPDLPEKVLSSVTAALEDRTGKATTLRAMGSVGGGCINPSARLESEEGESFFLKWNPSAAVDMFEAEADGLQALGGAVTLRVPEVLGCGGSGSRQDPGWLLLEFIPRGSAGRDYGKKLGEGLARLHGFAAESVSFGWSRDNFIGSLPQANDRRDGWARFWAELRLEPQIAMARQQGFFGGGKHRMLEDLLSRLDEILADDRGRGPDLLHGDLWSGNYYPDGDGNPVLIDPAVYRGVGEVDLAMMELFGSLPGGFRGAYEAVRPISPGYEGFKRDLYQLYYLLVHVNLFGGGYEAGSLAAARRVLSAT
jgi:fructosamine-3-kinase